MIKAARIFLFLLALFMALPVVAVSVSLDTIGVEADYAADDIVTSMADGDRQADDVYDKILSFHLRPVLVRSDAKPILSGRNNQAFFPLWRPPMVTVS